MARFEGMVFSEKSINWVWAKKVGREKFLKALESFDSKDRLTEMFDKKFGKPAKSEK